MNPNYNITKQDSIQVLEVKNLLNEMTNKEILQAVQSKIDEGFSNFVVDLGQIPYMNSVGLNFLITLQARCTDQGGRLVVANASKKVVQLLEVTKLLPLFHLTDSMADAMLAMQQQD